MAADKKPSKKSAYRDIHIWLLREHHARIEKIATAEHHSVTNFVEMVVLKYLDALKPNGPKT